MAQPQVNQQARPWDPKFTHADRERWICVYPAYLNSKKSVNEGRRIPKEKCVDNPLYTEIRDVCLNAGLAIGHSLLLYLGETIPKLKTRQHSGSGSQGAQQQQQSSGKGQKKKGRKGK
ncbi:SRP19-like protein [Mya arenaria]|uniref:SRP19-like protein n=1 Tax=Mya arenaria TaxID=6604 RepID=A0ABY7GC73_MYAAR|nr:SRP19-like protein [Mya arenaria]